MNECWINSTFLSNTDRVKRKHQVYQYGAHPLPVTLCSLQEALADSNDKTKLSPMVAISKKIFNTKITLGSSTTCTCRNILFILWLNKVTTMEEIMVSTFLPSALPRSYYCVGQLNQNELTRTLHP